MTGVQHTLDAKTVSGITISSSMTSAHELETKARIGGSETFIKKYTRPEFTRSRRIGDRSFYDNVKNDQLNPAQQNDNPAGGKTTQTQFALSAATGYLQVHRTVETVIGSSADLESAANVEISAEATETGTMIMEAGATQSESQEIKTDIGAAISVATFDTNVRAVVNDGAQIDASRELTVEASNVRKLPAPVDSAKDFGEFLLKQALSNPADVVGTVNKPLLHPLLTTGWAYTHVAPKKSDVSVGFALQLAFYDNTTEAIIAPGALINQDAQFQSDEQSVSVDAETELLLVNMAGVFDFALNLSNVVTDLLVAAGLNNLSNKLKLKKHPLVEVGVEGESKAWGTTFQWVDVANATTAGIGLASPVDDAGDEASAVCGEWPGESAYRHRGAARRHGERKGLVLWICRFGGEDGIGRAGIRRQRFGIPT